MNKTLVLLLAFFMVLTISSCSKPAEATTTPAPAATPAAEAPKAAAEPAVATTTPSTGTVDTEYDPNKVVEFTTQTNEENRIVNIGTADKSLYASPILVTSFGQSTDAAMLDTVMKRVGVEYKYNATATADDLSGFKTVIIAVGASTKGLGAAGISEADETARAKAIMQTIKDNSIEVICCHIGGSSRRGALSDIFADMVMEQCSLIVLKEDANFDYKFTKYAEEHNLPISLIYATKDTVNVFTDLLK